MALWERIIRISSTGEITKEYSIHGHHITTVSGVQWAAAVRSGEPNETVIEYPDTFKAVVVRAKGSGK